ncbi:hypothetical protein L3X38_010564 [Prunus dulcis]|uniref:Retrovirus-related Pol polyprotein from transposon TNT 1-94-like beta-barrel domain-containing protein n=1 Tax=Prunus dulcis TaxID=3755 RepID=A0AAD4WGJ9_PRUDU|nr:hypothetical protein L3X38_010564 [Prunus dulcis]
MWFLPDFKFIPHHAHSASQPTDNIWLADSGASNHVTSNMSNLRHSSPYTGSETLRVGDGNSLPISNTGSTILHTSNAKFHLLNVLHTPQVAHNLLSVHKFVSDNHCSLIFDEIGVSIKDNATQRMLCQGPCEQDLYPIYYISSVQVAPLSSGTSHIAFLVSKASLQTWHKRLGHPHSAVLKTIVTSNKLPRGVVDIDEEGVKGSLVALPRIQSVQWGLEKLVDIECCSFLSLISYDTFH